MELGRISVHLENDVRLAQLVLVVGEVLDLERLGRVEAVANGLVGDPNRPERSESDSRELVLQRLSVIQARVSMPSVNHS